MNRPIFSLLILLALTGCHGAADQSPAEIASRCNTVASGETVDPGLACFQAEPRELTGVDFGDSLSLGWTVDARHDLCGVMDLRHDDWARGDVDLCGEAWNPYDQGQQVKASDNNGFSSTELDAIEKDLADPATRYNVCAYNSGYHDMQRIGGGPVKVPLDVYQNNLEAEAQVLERHCDVVLWVDSTPMPGDRGYAGDVYVLTVDVAAYNAAGRAVAARHGFYQLAWDGDPQHDPRPNDDVHFTQAGYAVLGGQVTDCVVLALNQESSAFCHR